MMLSNDGITFLSRCFSLTSKLLLAPEIRHGDWIACTLNQILSKINNSLRTVLLC
jgi:hypothetical protein